MNEVNSSPEEEPKVDPQPVYQLSEEEPDIIAAILAYVPLLCFYPLLFRKTNSFAYQHGKQGLVLFIAELIAIALRWNLIWNLMLMCLAAVAIWAMVTALRGQNFRIPVLSDLVDQYLS